MKYRFSVRSVLIALFALSLIGSTALGQVTRTNLSGLINDQTGAAVSGAKVVAKHVNTNEVFQTTTDAQGAFIFPSMPLGKFSVTIEAAGFKRIEAQDVTLEVGTPAKLNVSLEVGQVSDAVTVSGTQEMVNTSTPTLTSVVKTNQIKDLPLPTRNVLDLARLQAGVAVTGTDTRNASVGGLRGSGTYVTQDGINAMDNFVKNSAFFAISAPSLDSIQEFSLTVGTVGSDAGRGVAQVTMVTKPGTNEYHGRLFYQHRNDALNANTFFNNATFDSTLGTTVPKPVLRQHFAGFNVGGPVLLPKKPFGPLAYNGHDKSFFFFSYEAFRENFQVTRNRTVLTPEARQGLFRYTDSNKQMSSVNLLGIGSVSALNPVTTKQLNAMPAPNNTLVGDGLNTAGYRFNVNGTDPSDKYVGRFDQQLLNSSRLGSHKLEFVYNYANFLLTPDTFNNLEAPFPGGANGFQSSTRTLVTAAIQSTFGSRITNEVRVGHQRAPVLFLRDGQPTIPFLDLNSVQDFDNSFMSQGRNTFIYQYIDNFSVVVGPHSFRMGTDIQSISANTFNDAGLNQTTVIGSNSANGDGILAGAFPNLPAGSTGTAIVNRAKSVFVDLSGLLASSSKTFNVTSPTSGFVPGATRERDFKQRSVSLYFQDQWRARRNFTFNYGLRYEFQGVPFESNGVAIQPANAIAGLYGISGLNNLFKPGTLTGSAPTSLVFVNGDTGTKLYGNDWNNFAPRIGFAFEIAPKSVLRGGYGIFYGGQENGPYSNPSPGFNPPFFVTQSFAGPCGAPSANPALFSSDPNLNNDCAVPGVSNQPSQNPGTAGLFVGFPATALTDPNTPVFFSVDQKLRTPYMQQWHLGVEQELPGSSVLELTYAGSKGTKLYTFFNGNQAAPDPDPTSPTAPRRPVPSIDAGIDWFRSTGKSSYHSLQAHYEKRFQHGLQFQASYTWAHSLDISSNANLGPTQNNSDFRDFRFPGAEYGNSDFDVRHRFVFSSIYELPFGRGKPFLGNASGLANEIVGGWQMANIVSVTTGNWYTVLDGNGNFANADSNAGGASQRPDQIGDPHAKPCVAGTYFNTCAFGDPAAGSFGNVGRNTIQGPGNKDWDFSVFKTFSIVEKAHMEFRAEFFNILNHTNFLFAKSGPQNGNGSTILGASQFGFLTAARDPRQIQLALKLSF